MKQTMPYGRERLMNRSVSFSGEASNHKLAAVFDDRGQAEDALQTLAGSTGLAPNQMRLLDRQTKRINRKLLPESTGIGRTLVRSHIVFGIVGLWFGLLLFLILNAAGQTFVTDNPIASLLLFLHVATLFGLMVGGLLTLRPDQVPYIRVVREALQSGRAVVVVHATSSDELGRAHSVLDGPAERVIATA